MSELDGTKIETILNQTKKTQLIWPDMKQVRGFLGMRVTGRGGRGRRKLLEVMDVFITLLVVMVSPMFTYKIVHFRQVQFPLRPSYLHKSVPNRCPKGRTANKYQFGSRCYTLSTAK